MKRVLASLCVAVALAACGSPLAKPETPQQALSVAAQRATQLKSARFDFSGNVQMTLPAALSAMFGQSTGGNGTLNVSAAGTGAAQFPDRYQASITVKMSTFQVATEVIVAGGKGYVKNPLTGKWQASTASGSFSDQLGEPDPLTYDQYLKNVASIKDLGDTTLNDGTAVHHYLLTPDKAKLLASMEAGAADNPQALATLKQVLNSGTMTIEVWLGKSDHLVRRLQTNANYTIDLNQLMSSLGSAAGSSGSRLPGGSTIHAVATVTINYHDFDAPVTIAIPALS